MLEKQIHVRNLHQRNQRTFTKFREIFTILKNDNNEENWLIINDTNTENNNNEDNPLRLNGSNVENRNNESSLKSNQGKLAFILGDSKMKDMVFS